MEETRNHPTAAERMLKYSPMFLSILAVVIVALLVVSAAPAKAAQPDYAALYQEAQARIAELEQHAAEDAEQLEAKEKENVESATQLAAKDEEIALLLRQMDEKDAAIEDLNGKIAAAEQKNQRLVEQYGTIYYAEYKLSRNGTIVGIGKTYIPKEVFERLDIGDTLPTDWEYLSYPESTLFTQWSATIIDLKPLNAWDENP